MKCLSRDAHARKLAPTSRGDALSSWVLTVKARWSHKPVNGEIFNENFHLETSPDLHSMRAVLPVPFSAVCVNGSPEGVVKIAETISTFLGYLRIASTTCRPILENKRTNSKMRSCSTFLTKRKMIQVMHTLQKI